VEEGARGKVEAGWGGGMGVAERLVEIDRVWGREGAVDNGGSSWPCEVGGRGPTAEVEKGKRANCAVSGARLAEVCGGR
jgi:hypothetical protein